MDFLDIIEFAGTFAFAISGIRLASTKQFDWFGAFVIGFVTAVGGGTIRDLMLNLTPFWMLNEMYIVCATLALFVVLIYRKILVRLQYTFFTFDTIGLALFTVVGIEKTMQCGFPFWVAIIMGTITGSAGSIIRDTLINELPLVFRKEIYALTSVFGGVIYWLCHIGGMSTPVTEILSAVSVIVARVLAVKYKVGLPVLKGNEEK